MTKALAALSILFIPAESFGQGSAPSFDAASIKPSNAKDDSSSWNSRLGYIVMRNQTLNNCIRIAYGLKPDQVSGGPKWLDADRFDIEARATIPAKDPELLAMLQTLLAERFKLKFHRDSKLVSGYTLVVGKRAEDSSGGGERPTANDLGQRASHRGPGDDAKICRRSCPYARLSG